MVKRAFALILALLAMALLGACSTQPAAIEDDQVLEKTVHVVVTRDFGRGIILEKETPIGPETSALQALQAVAEVETKYGGGFISSISGVGSEYGSTGGNKKDWFFYINGIAANVGAGDYILRAGEVEHWDFREWDYQQFVPAIIGDYPQPFRSGCGGKTAPTVVVYEEPFAATLDCGRSSLPCAGNRRRHGQP